MRRPDSGDVTLCSLPVLRDQILTANASYSDQTRFPEVTIANQGLVTAKVHRLVTG